MSCMGFEYQVWEDFVKCGLNTGDKIRVNPSILASWERCKKRGQNYREAISLQLPPEIIEQRREAYHRLIKVAKPFLEELYGFVKGSGFAVVLLDKDTCILEVLGDEELLDKDTSFRIGEIWNEETKGTNAMGVVQVEKKPIQVYAAEHYVCNNHEITCSAAPILGVDGEMIGILDVSGNSAKVHKHTLGMVVAAVKAIENELRLKAASAEIIKSYHNLNAIIKTISEGIISFDENGSITNMNPVALNILNMQEENYQSKSLKRIIKKDKIINAILDNGQSIVNHEFHLEYNHKQVRILFTAHPILGGNKEICGGVAVIRELKEVHRLVNQMVGARASFTFEDIIGDSEKLQKCIKIAKDIADSTSSVILQGESGTGKEMFAQAIHNASNFRRGPFIAINCGALPRDLIESELFGYEEGAFTGARLGGQAGKFELANEGTIFLDEITDMPLDTQVALLRVLQEKRVVRIGGHEPVSIKVRVIAATNRNLKEEVRKGNFRDDLFYRLNVINIDVVPLREREGDILLLANYFLRKYSNMLGYSVAKFEPQVVKALENYDWPGNVRELANAMERAVNLAKGRNISLEHLPEGIQAPGEVRKNKRISRLQKSEEEIILETLDSVGWNISQGASILGIARNTLYRKLEKYHLTEKK
ncbi:Transcriptional regulator of acetoin/glycerol metabolism [Desulfosporosinus lacus DSM 15449]|uniref:Transcriptional regulator of acetoin/glycerol metabolism n=2 Tax=Desulfosporosinus TaxID=79206 RepID=A0A1M5V5K5_9FIRM|nr:Transcriptional regulator of acetoin/glycerol metabolism [Desulfosporosinus lacus DSM 15449]